MSLRRPPEEHENLERWLVSYADFITLLFAFFVVMYAISSINEGKYRVLSESINQAFSDKKYKDDKPIELRNPPPGALIPPIIPKKAAEDDERLKSVAKDLNQVMNKLVEQGQVRVTQSIAGISVEINASVLFSPGSAVLEPSSTAVLSSVAAVIATVSNAVQVEGHTDNIPIATLHYPSNWGLSTARASSVVRLFVANGVAPDRLTAAGFAEWRPVASNDSPENRARNRRVTIMIAPDRSRLNERPLTAEDEKAPAQPLPPEEKAAAPRGA